MGTYVEFNPEIEINSDEWSKMMIKLRDQARQAKVEDLNKYENFINGVDFYNEDYFREYCFSTHLKPNTLL